MTTAHGPAAHRRVAAEPDTILVGLPAAHQGQRVLQQVGVVLDFGALLHRRRRRGLALRVKGRPSPNEASERVLIWGKHWVDTLN